MEKFCRPTFLVPSNNKHIKKLAIDLTKGTKSTTGKVRKLFHFVKNEVGWDITITRGAKRTLMRGKGICIDKASLFIALCRAIGIPSRYIILLKIRTRAHNKYLKEMGHVATEVVLNGKWKCIDPCFGPATKELIRENTFTKPSWEVLGKTIRVEEFSPWFLILSLVAINVVPYIRRMKTILKEHYKRKATSRS